MSEIAFFSEYGININIDRHSGAMYLARKKLMENDEKLQFIKNLQNQALSIENKCYIIFQNICAFDLIKNTATIDWEELKVLFNMDFIIKKLTLTRGQQKLLLLQCKNNDKLDITSILNVYQLIVLNYMLEKYNFNVYDSPQYLGEHLNIYQGKRELDISELYEDFFNNPDFNNNSMEEYMCFAIGKLYSFVRFNPSNQGNNIHQLSSLLRVYTSNDNTINKLRRFLTVLDDNQIIDIGF